MFKRIVGVCCLLVLAINVNARQKPNVIFILADDLGYGDLGCYGQRKIETPNIDKLAAGGMLFTQFYAGTSVCAPSRASLMTGQHTGHTSIRGNYEIKPEGQLPIPDSVFTMAELFRKSGYATGNFGKWGLGYVKSEGDPLNQGFDDFFGYNCQREGHNYFPDHLWENDTRVALNNTFTQFKDYAPELIQKKAMHFLEKNKNKPFFMYLSHTLPHAGLQLPEGDQAFEYYKKKFNEAPKSIKSPWRGAGYQPQAYPHAAYAAMVARLDKYVGQVMAKLKELGLDKNTLVVFTSDNGPHVEGGNDPQFFNSNAGFRGVKRALYEGGIREPMIVNWKGKVKPKTSSAHISGMWDFFATFADLLGQPLPKNVDGISILPTLKAKGKQQEHEFMYWEFHEEGGRQAVRMGKWKGVRNNVNKGNLRNWELYDLEKDRSETTDLANSYPDILKKIADIAHHSHQSSVIPEWNFVN